MAYNAVYIGMGVGMIIYVRLAERFSNKALVLTGLFTMLLMNIICATVENPILAIAATLLLGFGKILALGEIYLAWLNIWSKKMETAKLYPFFYFIALAGLYFMTWLTAFFTKIFDWHYAYIIILILILVCIILTIVFVENHKLKKKIPLYQLDAIGVLLFVSMLMLINYVATYGKVEDWFASNRIWAGSFGIVLTGLLFIKRETLVKRPFFDLSLCKTPQFSSGLLYLIFLGMLLPATFQSSLSGAVLHFESIRNSELSLYLVPGIITGCIGSYFWYKMNYDGQLLMIIGFITFVIYYLMLYNSYINDLNINAFWLPSLFKGFALALLYISIGLYATAKLPFPTVLKANGIVVVTRSFVASGVFSGLYNYFLYASRIKHLSRLASVIDANDPLILQYGTNSAYANNIQQQATLTALKELSGYILIISLAFTIFLIGLYLYKRVKHANQPIIVAS
ncbi:MFS transporter [Mucilaginibacter sp.]|uniref:MFS transporter n=1 Tax=Mucilaginibacter sp. TaxID=1882438 RepID=UPI00260A2B32|nr:MFS transporter [Mucilaginibacter sp.]